MVPPGLSELTECDQVAAPTVSMTASTRSGSRAPGSKTRSAPISSARAPLASSRRGRPHPVVRPPSRAAISAVATPPPAPWTSTVPPGCTPDLVKSMRYAVSHAVERHAAVANDIAAGLGTTLPVGTRTFSASVPSCSSDRSVRRGSRVSSPRQPSEGTTAWTMTSLPSASTPAPSQPRIIGSRSCARPTPRRDHTSWWLSAAARRSTRSSPAGPPGRAAHPRRGRRAGRRRTDWRRRQRASQHHSDRCPPWTPVGSCP